MLKGFIDWLLTSEPVSRWILILMLLGIVAGIAFAIKNLAKPGESSWQ